MSMSSEFALSILNNKYVLTRLLGNGGFGEVYEAYDPRLGTHYAVKIVHCDTEEKRRQERRDEQQEQLRAAVEQRVHSDELARRAADARSRRHDRVLIAQALDEEWPAKASLLDLATVWRAGRSRESDPAFPEARAAAEFVEDRLREVYPRPMGLYDLAVAAGAAVLGVAAARHEAAVDEPEGLRAQELQDEAKRFEAAGGATLAVGSAAVVSGLIWGTVDLTVSPEIGGGRAAAWLLVNGCF